jgi:hypothetical protein
MIMSDSIYIIAEGPVMAVRILTIRWHGILLVSRPHVGGIRPVNSTTTSGELSPLPVGRGWPQTNRKRPGRFGLDQWSLLSGSRF